MVDTKSLKKHGETTPRKPLCEGTDRINEMKEVFEMFHIQHLRVTEIMSRKGMKRYKVYHFLRTFAADYPERAEEMKKLSGRGYQG